MVDVALPFALGQKPPAKQRTKYRIGIVHLLILCAVWTERLKRDRHAFLLPARLDVHPKFLTLPFGTARPLLSSFASFLLGAPQVSHTNSPAKLSLSLPFPSSSRECLLVVDAPSACIINPSSIILQSCDFESCRTPALFAPISLIQRGG